MIQVFINGIEYRPHADPGLELTYRRGHGWELWAYVKGERQRLGGERDIGKRFQVFIDDRTVYG